MGKRALIVYTSITGNTQAAAFMLAEALERYGVQVHLAEAHQADPSDYAHYDLLLLGTYTYGNHAEIPSEMMDYYEEIPRIDLSGKPFIVFGSGDRYYKKFCQAVIDFEAAFLKSGAIKVGQPILIEKYPDSDAEIKMIETVAKNIVDYKQI